MAEGGRTRTRAEVPVGSRAAGQTAANAYDTAEGATGRMLGQANELTRRFNAGPNDALRAASDIAESGQTRAALAGNLGDDAATSITRASRAQTESARRLSPVARETASAGEDFDAEDLGRTLLALNPASMPTTKLFAITNLMRLGRLPEARASQIVDMLFSQNPQTTNAAIALLQRAGPVGRAFLGNLAAQAAGSTGTGAPATSDNTDTPFSDLAPDEEETLNEDFGEQRIDDSKQENSSYADTLSATYENEDPEFLDLWQRQTGQESQRQQFDASGSPLESSAGAIGIAQVMPDTAPEAARLAGLPWDEEAYYNDPAYNELLGMAYMREMLRQFGGDVELALAAYNAGPGAVQKAGGVPRIAETQNYVDRIMRGG